MGAGVGRSCSRPEELLGRYDLVFAKARCALEALAVGAAVVLVDVRGAGPMVTMQELEQMRRLNFGMRLLTRPIEPEGLLREIERYVAQDAAEVSKRIRETAGLDQMVEDMLGVYAEVLAEPSGSEDEDRLAAAAYFQGLGHLGRGYWRFEQSAAFRRMRLYQRSSPRLGALLQWVWRRLLARLR